MKIGLRRLMLTFVLVVAAMGTDIGSAQAAGGTLGRWTQAPGITGSCFGGSVCTFSGSVSSTDCKEASGVSCSGTLAGVTTRGPASSCSGTGSTTFTYHSGTLATSRTIPVTVAMTSGVVSIDGSDGFLTVHATANVLCVPEVNWATSFGVPWSGVVSYAST
jgi:hypothetical protein